MQSIWCLKQLLNTVIKGELPTVNTRACQSTQRPNHSFCPAGEAQRSLIKWFLLRWWTPVNPAWDVPWQLRLDPPSTSFQKSNWDFRKLHNYSPLVLSSSLTKMFSSPDLFLTLFHPQNSVGYASGSVRLSSGTIFPHHTTDALTLEGRKRMSKQDRPGLLSST